MTLESERLLLRPAAPADETRLHAMFTEAGVRRVIFDDQTIPPEQTAEIVAKSVELFAARRFGLWLAEPKSTSTEPQPGASPLVGFGGFWYFREPPELELLYGVGDGFVQRGYGREIACAIVAHGFDVLGMQEIRASTHPSHAASRRVLDDLGFTLDRQAVVDGLDTVFYRKAAHR